MGAMEGRITQIGEVRKLPGENNAACKDSKVWMGHSQSLSKKWDDW